jgi:hypothetical protein
MNIHGSGSGHTIKLFTTETCEAMKNMDVQERRLKLCGLLTAFFQGKMPQTPLALEIAKEMGVDQELVTKMFALMAAKGATGPSDAPNQMNRQPVTAGVFYTGVVDPLLDFGFEDLFDLVDMRGSMQTSFDILDVSNLITFAEVKTGERMKKYGIQDSKSTISKMTVAAALGILDDWIDYAQYWNLNQAAIEAKSKYYDKMATDHYALITAAAVAQAFATDDITTINNACSSILTACAAKGYTLTGNETFELRSNVSLKYRIEKAFALTYNSPGPTTPNQLIFALNRKYSTKLSTSEYYVVLAGRKLKRGIWSDLSAETDRDILMRGTDVAYSGEYNAGVGEVQQVRKLALS